MKWTDKTKSADRILTIAKALTAAIFALALTPLATAFAMAIGANFATVTFALMIPNGLGAACDSCR